MMQNDFPDLNEEILLQIKRDDPATTSVWVSWKGGHDSYANIVDWKQEGSFIGTNTHLKKLAIHHGIDRRMDFNQFGEFCRGLALNTSIEHLEICEYCINEATIAFLPHFMEHNNNLRCLVVADCMMDECNVQYLATALSRCRDKSTLERVEFDSVSIRYSEKSTGLISALNGHSNLVKVTLKQYGILRRECMALATLLENPKSKLKELDLSENLLDDECITILTNAFVQSKTLSSVSMGVQRMVTTAGWQYFLRCLQSPSSTLERLCLNGNGINNEVAHELGVGLANGTTLKTLDISSCRYVNSTGWQIFFMLMRNPGSVLEELNLESNIIDDGVVPGMVDALASIHMLKNLQLNSISPISPQGWRTFFFLLQRPNLSLKSLSIRSNRISDAVVIAFANALTHNNTLETLDLAYNDNITTAGWMAISNTLCNKSSINNIFSSNHTLTNVTSCSSQRRQLPGELLSSLQMNENNNKVEVARQKILQHYFMNGDGNVEEFADMEWKVLPHAIAWAGRDSTGIQLLYRLFQSMPSLFGVDGKETTLGEKRKRLDK